MINVQWLVNGTCENCGKKNVPHCAEIDFDFTEHAMIGDPQSEAQFNMILCSDCIEDLKRRLS